MIEQFNVISILGSESQVLNPETDVATATKDLNRKTMRLHGRHAISWLLRGTFVGLLFLLGRYGIEGTIGGALSMTSAFLGLYVMTYMLQGHVVIHSRRQARLYWILNDSSNSEFSSDDPMVVTMPAQEAIESTGWYGGKTVS